MTTQTQVKKLGRPVTQKTARVRSSIKSVLKKHGMKNNMPVNLSTTDVAKLAKQSKERTIFALRYFEAEEMILCVGRCEPAGRGQPPKLWNVTSKIFD